MRNWRAKHRKIRAYTAEEGALLGLLMEAAARKAARDGVTPVIILDNAVRLMKARLRLDTQRERDRLRREAEK